MEQKLSLIRPDLSWADEIMAYRREMLDAGSSMDGCGSLRSCESAGAWLDSVRAMENRETVPAGKVCGTQYVCVREADRRIVGMLQLRHELNEYLEQYGGHIGYSVRPSERRKGCAGWMLANILPVCRRMGLDRVLVVCLKENEASRRVILKNGGVYENTVFEGEKWLYIERYWMNL